MAVPATDATPPLRGIGETTDMEQLMTKADAIRSQVDELMSLRDSAVASARQQAQAVLDEAHREAKEVVDKADLTAKATIEQAHNAAGEMIRAVRDEMQQLIDATTQRKSALDTALSAFDSVPDTLTAIREEPEPPSPSFEPEPPSPSLEPDPDPAEEDDYGFGVSTTLPG